MLDLLPSPSLGRVEGRPLSAQRRCLDLPSFAPLTLPWAFGRPRGRMAEGRRERPWLLNLHLSLLPPVGVGGSRSKDNGLERSGF